MSTAPEVVARRRARRRQLLNVAREFALRLDGELGVRAVVVFGSVARGDFHDASDVDVLVVAESLPTRAPERLAALGLPPPGVEVVAWTSGEWAVQRRRGNPIAVEATDVGVWLAGSPDDLGSG